MHVGGEPVRQGLVCGRPLVDPADEHVVLGAVVRVLGQRVARPQRRPPGPLEPLLEPLGVRRRQDVAHRAELVHDHERQAGIGDRVGPCVDVSQQVRIVVERRGVAARLAGEQADPVERGQVGRVERPDGSGHEHDLLTGSPTLGVPGSPSTCR